MVDDDVLAGVQDRLTRYRSAMNQVHGWFAEESAEIMATLLAAQVEQGIAGDVAEIGVHHGKSFLLLANGTQPGEQAVALDVFGMQEKNVDRSGLGDRARFEANVASFATQARVRTLEESSLDVTPSTARDVFGHVRMFSVDGGHTADITAHDLGLAEACLVPDGIVVLDDVLNAHWLGVVSGLFQFLATPTALRPFAYSDNKLYLASSAEVAAQYRRLLRTTHADLLGKVDVEMHGLQIDVYGQGSPQRARISAENAQRSTALQREVADLRKRNAVLQADLRTSRRRVAAIEKSRSWRSTAPLRAVTARVSAARNGSVR